MRLFAPRAERKGIRTLLEPAAAAAEPVVGRRVAELGPALPPKGLKRADREVEQHGAARLLVAHQLMVHIV